MKKLLLLHYRHTADDADMWRTAIRTGWSTERTNMWQIEEHCKGYDFVRYYGNTLHAAQIKDKTPFRFLDIDPIYLANLPQFTKRKIELIHFESLHVIPYDCFIKPAREKWFEAKVYKTGESIQGSPLDGDDIYISEIVKFEDEVRCFVLNGEIKTSSYYRINSVVWDATNETAETLNFDQHLDKTPIREYVREIVKLCPHLPPGLVIDFGRLPNGEWALVEFNEAWACGLYYCDPEKCLEVIVASQS